MDNGQGVVCPAALVERWICRLIRRLEQDSNPDPETAREILRMCRGLEIHTGQPVGMSAGSAGALNSGSAVLTDRRDTA